jgi:hypothetical protein
MDAETYTSRDALAEALEAVDRAESTSSRVEGEELLHRATALSLVAIGAELVSIRTVLVEIRNELVQGRR